MDRDSNLMLTAVTTKEPLIWEKRKVEAFIVLQIRSIMKGSSNKMPCGGVDYTDLPMETYMRGSSSLISVADAASTLLVMGQKV
jgi:hypothetical protein